MNGMMEKITLLALMLAFAIPAIASDWKYLGTDGKGNHYFYKPKTYSISGNKIASSWTKVEHKVDEAVMKQKKIAPDDYVGISSTVVFEQYHCVEKKKMTLVGKHYEGIDDNDVQRTGWVAVQPASTDEGLLIALCKEGANKKERDKTSEKK